MYLITFKFMKLLDMTFSPKKIIREIKKNPQGITQQAVLEKTVAGYKGSDNSASFTSRFREMEEKGYIKAVRNTKRNQPIEGSRVIKWYPTNKPYGLRNSIAQFLINS